MINLRTFGIKADKRILIKPPPEVKIVSIKGKEQKNQYNITQLYKLLQK